MIISRGRNYIFVHIPKTGGTSMALALEARAMKDDIMLGDTPKALKRRRRVKDVKTAGRLWKHSTLADINGLVAVEDLPGFKCFTLVRNPWDRMVSYYYWLQLQSFDHASVALAKSVPFADFVGHPQTLNAFKANPAGAYLTDVNGSEQPAHYIRLEHLAEDLKPLQAHLGFDLSLSHTNTSDRRRDWRIYYSDASAESVAEACAEDITRFGYQFEPTNS